MVLLGLYKPGMMVSTGITFGENSMTLNMGAGSPHGLSKANEISLSIRTFSTVGLRYVFFE